MTIKPEGLKLPECECFKKKANAMNKAIDQVAAILFVEALQDASSLDLCPAARDYFFAAIIWQMLSGVLIKDEAEQKKIIENKGVGDLGFAQYRKHYEDAWERLKPLIMQRIDYADGVMQNNGLV